MKVITPRYLFIVFVLCITTNSIFPQIKLDNIYNYEDGISYSVVLPINYNKNKKYALAIGLHGLYSDGIKMVNPFSYYSRYMNIILVCPDGNFPDNGRNGVKWGYEKSEKYILDLVELIKSKYKVYDDVFLFGFSQGGNQGIQTALSNPDIFRYFAGLSGGYTRLTDKQIQDSRKINIYFLSGDTGDGEIFTKREMDNRFQTIKRYNPYAIRKIYHGMKHEVMHEEAFDMFNWFLTVSRRNKVNRIIYEDYYKLYSQSSEDLANEKYTECIQHAKKSISMNRHFAPAYLNIVSSYLYMHDINSFKKYFFQMIELYSTYSFFDNSTVLDLIETIKLSDIDFLLQHQFLDFFQSKMHEYESKCSNLYKGELYLLIAELHIINHNSQYAKASFKKSLNFYSQMSSKESIYIDSQIKKKIRYINEYIKELEETSHSNE